MVNTTCGFCSKKFYKKPSQIKRCKNSFCSKECQYKARKNGLWVKCFVCKKDVYKQSRYLLRSQNGKYFCCWACSNKWHGLEFSGEKHPNWINGDFAYKNILLKTKRKIICFLCGNKNTKVIIVHHIDKNRKNNNSKNLMWLCRNCHHLVHNYKNVSVELTKIVKSNARKKM